MDLSFLSSMDTKTLFTVAMTLFASMMVMIGTRKTLLSTDNFESFLTMRLARLGILIISPLLYPYFVGVNMLRVISRRLDQSKIKLIDKKLKRLSPAAMKEEEDLSRCGLNNFIDKKKAAQTRLARTRAKFRRHIWSGSHTQEGDALNRMGAWLLGAVPIAAVACVTWIPELRSVDIGITEVLTTSLHSAGEWLVSIGGK